MAAHSRPGSTVNQVDQGLPLVDRFLRNRLGHGEHPHRFDHGFSRPGTDGAHVIPETDYIREGIGSWIPTLAATYFSQIIDKFFLDFLKGGSHWCPPPDMTGVAAMPCEQTGMGQGASAGADPRSMRIPSLKVCRRSSSAQETSLRAPISTEAPPEKM